MQKIFASLFEYFKQPIQNRFRFLNFSLGILCFGILPLLVTIRGLDSIAALEVDLARQQSNERLLSALDKLEMFSDNSRFAHWLLSDLCLKAGKIEDPVRLKRHIQILKKTFPDSFTFIVADENGNLLKEISDRIEFLYLYRQAFVFFSDLQKQAEALGRVENVENFSTRFKRLKPFLGNMLEPGDLKMLFLGKETGRSVLASGDREKFNLWYGQAGKMQLLVFISRPFIKNTAGLKWGSEFINRKKSGLLVGFSSFPPDSTSLFPTLSSDSAARVIRSLSRFEEMKETDDQLHSAEGFTRCRFLNQYYRGFAVLLNDQVIDQNRTRYFFVAGILKTLMIIFFVVLVYQLKFPVRLTVRLKIAAFFAYSIFLPLIVSASLGTQYVSQVEKETVSELNSRSVQTLEKIDAYYDWYLKRQSSRIDRYFDQTIVTNPEILLNKESAAAWYERLLGIANPGEVLITDEAKNDFLLGISRRVSLDRSPMCQAGSEIITTVKAGKIHRLLQNGNFFTFVLFSCLYDQLAPISYLGIAGFDMGVKFKIVKSTGKDAPLFFTAISWEMHRLQREYLISFKEMVQPKGFILTAYNQVEEKIETGPSGENVQLVNSLKISVNRRNLQMQKVRIGGRMFLLAGMQGRKLNRMILGALIPFDKILQKRNHLFSSAKRLFFLVSILSLATIFLLQSWIFDPLKELMIGIKAISERDFHRRLKVRCNNEFGRLTHAFNRSIETLQELEVARTVQESLLAESRLDLERCSIVAKTRMMTNLGGDYYDFFKLPDNQVLVFIGDATGHGIPAALSMAMAKSVMLYEGFAGLAAGRLMAQINRVFCRLRSQGSKDFMTALCLQIDSISGAGTVINSGHCYPIIVRAEKKDCVVLTEARGFPPGFVKNERFFPCKFELETGDRLVLFTDGFIECRDENGHYLGFDGLSRILLDSYDSDVYRHLENVFAEFEKKSRLNQDDCTMVMLRLR
ncbi:MAG: PP2C family protein-serine/threonine phosphatase [Candidatus Rifleibacteriota bacterium]